MAAHPETGRRSFPRRVIERLHRHSIGEHVLGLWLARKFTSSGITVATGGFPLPNVLNEGGEIHTGNCQFYTGVRLEVGKGAVIRIGTGTYLNRNTTIVAHDRVEIGRHCRIAWDVVIMDTDQHLIPGMDNHNVPVVIEDFVWIGCRAIILKGVRIGMGSVVAAGAIVTRDVPPYSVVAGVPAKVLQKVERELTA